MARFASLRPAPLSLATGLLVAAAASSAHAGTITWDGGGGNLNWLTAANWSGDVLPGPGDDVVLDAAGAVTITLAGSATVNSLACADGLTITSGTLAVANTASVAGVLTFSGGGIKDGTWTTPGGIAATASNLNVLDGVTLLSSFTLSTNFASLVIKNDLTLNGTANLTGLGCRLAFTGSQTVHSGNFQLDAASAASPAELAVDGVSVVTLGPSVVVESKNGRIGDSIFTNGASTLVNQGTIREDTLNGTLTITGESFVNQGTVEATNGTLTLSTTSAWANDGVMQALTGGIVVLNGTVDAADFGDVRNVSGTVRLQTVMDLAGGTFATNATTGVYTLNGCTFKGGTFDTSSGILPIVASATNNFDDMTLHGNLTLGLNFSTLRIQNGLTLDGVISLSGLGARLSADNTQTIGGTGEIQLDAPGAGSPAQLTVEGTSVLTIGPNVTVVGSWGTIGGDAFVAGTSALINQGTIIADTPNTTLTILGESFTNDGQTKSTGGTLRITATQWTNPGTVTAVSGTVRLEGATDLASILHVSNGGGVVQSSVSLDLVNQSLTLTAANGVFTFDGGTWSNGTVTFEPGATPLFTSASTTFKNMVVNGDLSLASNFATLRIRDAFTLNGTLTLSGIGSRLSADNTLTINAGTIRLRSPSSGSPAQLSVEGTTTLTLGPAVLVESGWGTIGDAVFIAGTSKVINQGTIRADTTGTTTTIVGEAFENSGTCEGTAGTLRLATTGANWINTGLIRAVTAGAVNIAAATSVGEFGDVRNVSGTVRLQAPIVITGGTFSTSATTGIYTFDGVTFANGTLNIAPAAIPIVSSANNTLTGMTVNGTLNLSQNFATLRLKDSLVLNGQFNLTGLGARVSADNSLSITGNASIQLDGTSSGSVTQLTVEGASTLTLGPTVAVESAWATLGDAVFVAGTSKLINQGTIRADVANSTTTILGEAFENQGTVEATAGTLRLATVGSNWKNTGLIRALTTGTVTLAAPTTLAEFGDVRNVSGIVRLQSLLPLGGATFNLNATTGVYTFDGATVSGGVLGVDGSAPPVFTSANTTFTGMTVNGSLNLNQNFSTLRLKDSFTLNGTANLTGLGSRISADTTLTIDGNASIQLDSVASGSPSQLSVEGVSTLTIAPTVLIESKWGTIGDAVFLAGTSSVINNGTIRADTPSATLTIVGEGFQNNATVEATNSSTLVLNVANNLAGNTLTGGTWKATNATIRFGALPGTAIKTLAAECVLSGRNGKILDLAKLETIATTGVLRLNDGAVLTAVPATGTLVDNGFLFLNGTSKLNVTGGFTHAPTAILTLATGAANQVFVDASAALNLDGFLQVSNGPGYTPVGGDQIVITDGSSRVGTFDTVTTCELADMFYTPTQAIYVYGEDTGVFADLNGDGFVGAPDLALLLGSWGPCSDLCCNADLDLSGDVGAPDIALLLGGWG